MTLTRYPKQMRENVKQFDMKTSTDSWTKMRDLRQKLIVLVLEKIRQYKERNTGDVMWEACPYSPIYA